MHHGKHKENKKLPIVGNSMAIETLRSLINQKLSKPKFSSSFILNGSKTGFNSSGDLYLFLFSDRSPFPFLKFTSKSIQSITKHNYFYSTLNTTKEGQSSSRRVTFKDIFPNPYLPPAQESKENNDSIKQIKSIHKAVENSPTFSAENLKTAKKYSKNVLNDKLYKKIFEKKTTSKEWLTISPKSKTSYPVLAMDCEMVLTTAGSELARITILDENLDIILDKLVKPSNRIKDYCTRWSGLTPKIMENANETLEDIHCKLKTLIGGNTTLIGHSLFNDLEACKLKHSNIIDTAYLFKSGVSLDEYEKRKGTPIKLKTLLRAFLGIEIQNSRSGHCSKEDTLATILLARVFAENPVEIIKIMENFNKLKPALNKASENLKFAKKLFEIDEHTINEYKESIFSYWNSIIKGNRKLRVVKNKMKENGFKVPVDEKFLHKTNGHSSNTQIYKLFDELFEYGLEKNCFNFGIMMNGHLGVKESEDFWNNYICELINKLNKNDSIVIVKIVSEGPKSGNVLVVQKD